MIIQNTLETANTLPQPKMGQTIGLFGGSFNPAHDGHTDVSQYTIKTMGLDEIWWLVSPQNPLKSTTDMAPLNTRIQSCIDQTKTMDHIRILGLETLLKTQYTVDTIQALQNRFHDVRFVWIMGADNLETLPQWKNWQALWHAIPIAIVKRHGYEYTPLNTPVLQEYASCESPPETLAEKQAPAWAMLAMPPNPISSTHIRNR